MFCGVKETNSTKVGKKIGKNGAKKLQEVTRMANIEQSVDCYKVNHVIEHSAEWMKY